MPAIRPTAAVHYFFLLRDDAADLAALWSAVTEGGSPISPAPGLDLGLEAAGTGENCQIVHRISGEEGDFCLVMLPRLAVVAVFVRSGATAGSSDAGWENALKTIDGMRRKQADLGISLFGETTALAGSERDFDNLNAALSEPGSGQARASFAGGEKHGREHILSSRLGTALAGGNRPALLFSLDSLDGGRHLFAVAADRPDALLSMQLPQIDAAIRFLLRESAHFAQQRHTIAAERASVDRQVGELLHRQVVAAGTGARVPEQLEEKIAALSRHFGMLATDSLLVRQAEDRLRGNLEGLAAALAPCVDAATDEIGSHFRRLLTGEIDQARLEAEKLNFARGNAQAAIEVVRIQVELLRAGEEAAIQSQTRELLSRSLMVQQERLALQVAAGFVEFVLLFYYVLKSWEGIVSQQAIGQISPLTRMIVVGIMSLGATIGTHFLAKALHSRSWKSPGLWASAAVLLLTLAAMIALSR